MRNRLVAVIATSLCMLSCAPPALANKLFYGAKIVGNMRAISWCDGFFFTLQGVSMADPAIPAGGPYFGINRAKPGANDMIAMLTTAKATGRQVHVNTSGLNFCGQAEVEYIELL
jgi:hypothetical protein